jgi:hypothetical protein
MKTTMRFLPDCKLRLIANDTSNKDIYHGWLYSLRTLLGKFDDSQIQGSCNVSSYATCLYHFQYGY